MKNFEPSEVDEIRELVREELALKIEEHERRTARRDRIAPLCYVDVHDWTKWSEVIRYSAFDVRQSRVCQDCGIQQTRRVVAEG